MTVEIKHPPVGAGEHLVKFYENDSELAQTVGRFLADGVHAGGVAIVIATEAHRQAVASELEAAGLNVAAELADRRIVLLDAAATLSQFISDGRIDRENCRRMIRGLVGDASETGPVRAYGEMVALLWDAGNVIAAIELEELWNELGQELEFSLLCGYHGPSVSDLEHADALHKVCHLHTSILANESPNVEEGSELSRDFPAQPEAPGAARAFVAEVLHTWGRNGTLLQDAQLVVSELATNAVVHASCPFSVVMRSEVCGLRLSVHDTSRAQPRIRSVGPRALSGRGLHVIAGIAHQWGVEATGDGKAVWAELRW